MFASRTVLTLTALTLLAAGGVTAAAGQDENKRQDLGVRIESDGHDRYGQGGLGGWDWGGGQRPLVIAPSVVVERPVLVAAPVVGGVAPGSRDVQGFESGGTVIRLARGESTIAGFTTSLDSERDGRRDGVAHGRPNDARVCMSREERTVTAHRLKRVPVVC